MSLIVDGTTGVTFNDSSLQGAAASPYVLKNRIINGDMRIDQRNAGAAISGATLGTGSYTVDRWAFYSSLSSKFTIQQNAGGVTPPTGFTNYVGATVASAVGSLSASDYFQFMQKIEGYNISDLAWGTANAKTITISFWARSSQTGTFSASLVNQNFTRSYVFTYTISSANTWTYITATISGDTTGTWTNTTNSTLLYLVFNLGFGSTYQTSSPNTWLSGEYYQSSGSVTLVNTAGATFYITGVQLEIGSTATPFERRMYGQELALCQRYFEKSYNVDVAVNTNDPNNGVYRTQGTTDVGNNMLNTFSFKVMKRVSPTMTAYSQSGGSNNWDYNKSGTSSTSAISWNAVGQQSAQPFFNAGAAFIAVTMAGHWTASAEL